MNRPPSLEERLLEYSREFPYPPTPAIHEALRGRLGNARAVSTHRLVRYVVLAAVLILALALAVPQVRAQVLEIIRIGVVTIFPGPEVPSTPSITPTASQLAQSPLTATPYPVPTQQVEPDYITSLEGLAGETTLEQAQIRVSFTILLPSVPAGIGKPDYVFLQEGGQMVILAWLEAAGSDKVRLSLHEIGPGSLLIEKYEPRLIEQTQVNGHDAAWVAGPYLVKLTNGDTIWRRLVDGNTLIWEAGGITFR
ncbi:MAG TPA: hypothetical protein VIV15_02945, partial [Anaerolineales bacterium]